MWGRLAGAAVPGVSPTPSYHNGGHIAAVCACTEAVFAALDVGTDPFGLAREARRWAQANPAAVTGLIRGLVRAQYDSLADPSVAIAALRAREALTDVPLETERLRLALNELTFTPHVRANGFGRIDTVRLQRSIDMVREAFSIARPMPWGEVYDPRYLPPATDMRLA